MNRMNYVKLLVAVGCVLLIPAGAAAQSSIGGQVTDNTGGVLPGVTVEATSPALIEGARVAITDGTGQYAIPNLRPGTYALTFTLPGFGTQVRDGLVLQADFAMTIDIAMSVGAIEETVVVTGASPVVDVQTARRTDVLSRETQEELPTGRALWSYAKVIPGVRIGRPDVGGTSGHQQAGIIAAGAVDQADSVYQIDGMDASTYIGENWMPYLNPMLTAETSYTTSGIGAETQRGGVRMNIIPKEGGNQFSGSFFAGGSPTRGWQNSNWTPRLGDLGVQSREQGDARDGIERVDQLYDLNFEVGGPLVQDRLWFHTSARRFVVNNQVLNSFTRSGDPGLDTNSLTDGAVRLTWQASPNNKLSFGFDKLRKRRFTQHVAGDDVDTASTIWTSPHYDTGNAKWTSTVSSRMLVEFGFSLNYQDWDPSYQDGIRRERPTGAAFEACFSTPCFPAVGSPAALAQSDPDGWYGVLNHDDNWLQLEYEANEVESNNYPHSRSWSGSLSYVTGAHSFKFGVQNKWGDRRRTFSNNGNLYQVYSGAPSPFGRTLDFVDAAHFASANNLARNLPAGTIGTPDAVVVYNNPVWSKVNIDYDLGFFAQDAWTIDRLTFNYGLRVDVADTSVPAVGKEVGRFVPAQNFDAVALPRLGPDFSPRLSIAYDLFGDGRTALKLGWNRYVGIVSEAFPNQYAPAVTDTDRRDWFDLALNPATGDLYPGCTLANPFAAACVDPYGTNGDDIAQDWEIGPSGDVGFGRPGGADTVDPDIQRDYNDQWLAGIQQEIMPGWSVSAFYRRRSDHDTEVGDILLRNLASFGDTLEVARPAPYVGSFTIFNIDPDVRAFTSEFNRNAIDGGYSRVYNGFELTTTVRLPGGGQLLGGWTVEKTAENDCGDVRDRGDNPNDLRFCDQGAFPLPYGHEIKMSGSIPFSLPGIGDLNTGFSIIGGQIVPGLGLGEIFRYSRSTAANLETLYADPFFAADCAAPCVPGGRIVDRDTHPTISTSTSLYDAQILPDGSVKFHPALTQVDFNVAKVFNIGGWRYDARLEMFNLFNNDADRGHSNDRGTSLGAQSTGYEFANLLMPARLFRFAVTARF